MIEQVTYHRLAAKEARQAEAWYRRRNPAAADRFRSQVNSAAKRIADGIGVHQVGGAKFQYVYVRRFPYRLIFSMDGGQAMVIAVVHARRRPNYWRRRR